MTGPIVSAPNPGPELQGLAEPLITAATARDGVAPLSEAFERGLVDDRVNHTHYLTQQGDNAQADAPAALAAVAPDGSVELVVDPAARRAGLGRALVNFVRERHPEASFWAHGDLPAARALAGSLGMEKTRELLVMGTELDGAGTGAGTGAGIPDGYEVLSYAEAAKRWGPEVVDKQWLEVNNDAFSWHPEQGGWDQRQLDRAREAEWFREEGVRLMYAGDELAGFHWTKQHPDGTGEVYVVGLGSGYRGEGLGVPLLKAGLDHLAEEGSAQVILYVEADNEAAVKLYRRMGFVTRESHAVYR